MSESNTMFNEQDRRCAAVQLMISTDPSYDNRTIASTLQMKIRTVQRLRAQLPPSLEEKACSQLRIRIEGVIEAEGGYIE